MAKHWSETASSVGNQQLVDQFAEVPSSLDAEEEKEEMRFIGKSDDEMGVALDFLLNISTGEEVTRFSRSARVRLTTVPSSLRS